MLCFLFDFLLFSCIGSIQCFRYADVKTCMFVSCVHHVAVLNVAFCMICSLSMLVEDERGDHMKEPYARTAHDCLVGSHEML